MVEVTAIIVAVLSLLISVVTAWLTLFRRGTIKMTRPTVIFFGSDGSGGPPKLFLRTLLYSTAKRGQLVENMFVKLHCGGATQTFNIWVYGDSSLARGSGLYISEDGITCNHHFLLPREDNTYEFVAGDYTLEVYVTLVGRSSSLLLSRTPLSLTHSEAAAINSRIAGVYFDWEPDSMRYDHRIHNAPVQTSQVLERFQAQDIQWVLRQKLMGN